MLAIKNYNASNFRSYYYHEKNNKLSACGNSSLAYENGSYTRKNYVNLGKGAIKHIQKLEENKTKNLSYDDYKSNYNQYQIDFWKLHYYDLSNIVLQRSSVFSKLNQSNVDCGLAISILAA